MRLVLPRDPSPSPTNRRSPLLRRRKATTERGPRPRLRPPHAPEWCHARRCRHRPLPRPRLVRRCHLAWECHLARECHLRPGRMPLHHQPRRVRPRRPNLHLRLRVHRHRWLRHDVLPRGQSREPLRGTRLHAHPRLVPRPPRARPPQLLRVVPRTGRHLRRLAPAARSTSSQSAPPVARRQ
jgi:hypothetical protein